MDWNPEAQRIFGFTREEALGRQLTGLVFRGSSPGVKRARQEKRRQEVHEISAAITKDGRDIVCEWWNAPLENEDGRADGVICFVQDVTERERSQAKLREQEHLLRAVISNVPVVLWAIDSEGVFTFHDGKGLEKANLTPGQFLGQNIFDLYGPDSPDAMAAVRQALKGQTAHIPGENHGLQWESWVIPVFSENREVVSVIGLTLDVTEMRRIENELRARIEMIDKQQRVIRDLSTPIIQVWDGVLALPMVGIVDSGRIAEVVDNLLSEIVRTRTRHAILDLTGVDTVDTGTANHLLMLIRSIKLLGAEGIITGIRPTVAQTMVSLGMDLGNITTLANLRDGLKLCMAQGTRRSSIGVAPQ